MPSAGTSGTTSTKDRLLLQATKLFAAHGYDGAATEAIVRAARVNKRMLYHWYENKEGLYRAVLEAQWARLAMHLGAASGGDDRITALVDAAFDFVASHPEFVRLAMWEGLRGGQTSRRLWGATRGPLFAQAATLLGARAPGFDGRQLLISLLGAVAFYVAFAPSLVDALERDALSDAALRARKAHLHALLAAVFAAPDHAGGARRARVKK